MANKKLFACVFLSRAVGRLCCICAIGFAICIFILLYPSLDGLFYYRTGWEIVAGIGRACLCAMVFGAAFAAAAALIVTVLTLRSRPARKALWFKRVELGLTFLLVFTAGTLFLRNILMWLAIVTVWTIPASWKFGIWFVGIGILACLGLSRSRRQKAITALGRVSGSPVTRRNVMVLGGAATAAALSPAVSLAGDEPSPRLSIPPRIAQDGDSASGNRHKPNILLVTFDALNAEDMSVYGYRLPTTPHLERFAKSATVFRQFYSCSTFTTPSVVAFSCGRYLPSTKVYQLSGRLQGDDRHRTLPHALRQAGYETAASVANPFAHPAITHVGGYDIAPVPPIHDAFVRNFFSLRVPELWTDTKEFTEIIERQMDRFSPNTVVEAMNDRLSPPEDSFNQAAALWRGLRGPKFLHVHVFAPHFPYQPGEGFRGRFLETSALFDVTEGTAPSSLVAPFGDAFAYAPKNQPIFDRLRLRYDEWLCEADAAFGTFMAQMEKSGELKNTIVAVCADHGESFQGGVYSHGTPTQLRSIIHIPLIVHTPGQTQMHQVSSPADAASLAPTLLDLAGIAVPAWMEGTSLRGDIDRTGFSSEGYAFTQYFENNSAFAPITKGTIGAIDGRYQYIVDVQTGQSRLYELANAHLHSEEIAAKRPDIARALRERIRAKFPGIKISA